MGDISGIYHTLPPFLPSPTGQTQSTGNPAAPNLSPPGRSRTETFFENQPTSNLPALSHDEGVKKIPNQDTYNLGLSAVFGEGDDPVQPEVTKGHETATFPEFLAQTQMTDRKLASYYNQAYPNRQEGLDALNQLKQQADVQKNRESLEKVDNAITILENTPQAESTPPTQPTESTQSSRATEKTPLLRSKHNPRTMRILSKVFKGLAIASVVVAAAAFITAVVLSGGTVGALAVGLGAGIALGGGLGFGIGSKIISKINEKKMEKSDKATATTKNQTTQINTVYDKIAKFKEAYQEAKTDSNINPFGANWAKTAKNQLSATDSTLGKAYNELKDALNQVNRDDYPGIIFHLENLEELKGMDNAFNLQKS